jgi:hypothetical protein
MCFRSVTVHSSNRICLQLQRCGNFALKCLMVNGRYVVLFNAASRWLWLSSPRLQTQSPSKTTSPPSTIPQLPNPLSLTSNLLRKTKFTMSYNPNQPYDQWQQQQPTDPNQQQSQLNTPQPTTSSSASNPAADGGGNYQQSQQSYSWTDGNTQGQHHQSQQSLLWQGQVPVQQQITSPIAIQSPTPAFPPLLQDHNSHHLLHQQMHQNATSHFQQVQALQRQQIADMHRNMSSFAMGGAPPLMLQTQQQPQTSYQQVASPPPMQTQSIPQQSYLLQPQPQQAQIEYQPTTPAAPVQHVQYQNQPMPTSSYFPPQQARIVYQPMTPLPPVQQTHYQDTVSQNILPNSQPGQQRIEELLPPATSTTTVQPQDYDQRHIYQQEPTTQQYAASQPPQTQRVPPPVLQSPSEVPTQRVLQSQPNEHASQTARPVSSWPNDHRIMNLERQRRTDVEDTNRAGAAIHKRLRDLEHSRTQAQQDHDAKDHEVRRLQEQLASVERQRRQDAERNSQQLADLVRSQATSPAAPSVDAFDMSALQKVVRETQAHQLTAQDIERVIEEQFSKRLAGMATKQDIQNAGAQMQGALSRVPAGLSQQEVQQAVNRELNNVMQDVANRVNQQRRVAGQGQPNPRHSQAPQDRVQTEFVVGELPDDAVAASSHRARHHGSRTQKQVPPAEMGGDTAVSGPSTTTERALSSATTVGALRSSQSSIPSHVPAVSQRSTAPTPDRAQIAPPNATTASVSSITIAENALVTSRRPNPVLAPQLRALEVSPAAPGVPENSLVRTERPVPRANMTMSQISTPRDTQRIEVPATQAQYNPVANVAPQEPRLRTLGAPPAAPGVSEHSLARVERSVPRATLPSNNILPPHTRQRIEVPAAQRQLVAPLATTHQQILQQPSRHLRQIEPPVTRQGQLEAPSTQSDRSSGAGQELVLQGREVARKTSDTR